LLLALPGSLADELIAALTDANVQTAVRIGGIIADPVGIVVV